MDQGYFCRVVAKNPAISSKTSLLSCDFRHPPGTVLRSKSEAMSWICTVLRDGSPLSVAPASPAGMLAYAGELGVDALLSSQVIENKQFDGVDRLPFRRRLTAAVAADAARHHELYRLAEAWRLAQLQPILLKGSGLAYTHYPHPWLRPQADLDVWCAESDLAALSASLVALGYSSVDELNFDGKHQRPFARVDSSGVTRLVEIHLRALNPEVFADALDFNAARAAAVPVPTLPGAVTLSPPYALLLACLHRVAHHLDQTAHRVIWLYDIHLLAAAMTTREWQTFTRLASAARVRAVCRDSLERTRAALGTTLPPEVLEVLVTDDYEPSAAFLHPLRELDVRMSDLRAASGAREGVAHTVESVHGAALPHSPRSDAPVLVRLPDPVATTALAGALPGVTGQSWLTCPSRVC